MVEEIQEKKEEQKINEKPAEEGTRNFKRRSEADVLTLRDKHQRERYLRGVWDGEVYRIKCPHCKQPVDLKDYQFTCPSCQNWYHLVIKNSLRCKECRHNTKLETSTHPACRIFNQYLRYYLHPKDECPQLKLTDKAFLQSYRLQNIKSLTNKTDPKQVCKTFACQPTQALWRSQYAPEFEPELEIPVLKCIIVIERIHFEHHIYQSSGTVIDAAIYLGALLIGKKKTIASILEKANLASFPIVRKAIRVIFLALTNQPLDLDVCVNNSTQWELLRTKLEEYITTNKVGESLVSKDTSSQ